MKLACCGRELITDITIITAATAAIHSYSCMHAYPQPKYSCGKCHAHVLALNPLVTVIHPTCSCN